MLGEEGEETDQERAGSIDEERAIGKAASQKGGVTVYRVSAPSAPPKATRSGVR